MPVRVAVLDEEPIYRHGIELALADDARFQLVATEADDRERTAEQPDIVVIGSSDKSDIKRLIEETRASYRKARIVCVHSSERPELAAFALRCGASCFLIKTVAASELRKILLEAHLGASYVDPAIGAKIVLLASGRRSARASLAFDLQLREREKQILRCIGSGMNNKDISRELSISVKTVKCYTSQLYQKIGVRNRVEAAAYLERSQGQM